MFEKAASDCFPKSKPWDHTIKLKSNFISMKYGVIPLSINEQAKMDKFITENLAKGYLRELNSPMA